MSVAAIPLPQTDPADDCTIIELDAPRGAHARAAAPAHAGATAERARDEGVSFGVVSLSDDAARAKAHPLVRGAHARAAEPAPARALAERVRDELRSIWRESQGISYEHSLGETIATFVVGGAMAAFALFMATL